MARKIGNIGIERVKFTEDKIYFELTKRRKRDRSTVRMVSPLKKCLP